MTNNVNTQLSMWDITLSGEATDDFNLVRSDLCSIAKKWVFQEEESANGYVHWQIRLCLTKKVRQSRLVSLLKETQVLEGAHVSPTSNTVHTTEATKGRKAFEYVMKLDTRKSGPWSDKDPEPKFIQNSILAIKDLFPWQESVKAISEKIDLRTINCVVDTTGNNGKSTIVKWMVAYDKAVRLPVTRDYKDINQMALCIAESRTRKDPSLKTWMVDMPRGLEKKEMRGFYAAMETLKDGVLYDMRYKYREYIINEPNIWVFTNKTPDLGYMSLDRWRIWEISPEKELIDITTQTLNPDSSDSGGEFAYERERLLRTEKF